MSLRIDPFQQPALPIDRTVEVFGIPICRIPQGDGTNWCWAACIKMILNSYDLPQNDELCAIANKAVLIRQPSSSSDCCNTGGSACQELVHDDVITQVWHEYDITVIPVRHVPPGSATTLLGLLRLNHPVELEYGGDTGHVVLLYGWSGDTPSGRFRFHYHDPADKSNNNVRADRVGDNGDQGRLNAYWEIQPDGKPDPNCDRKVRGGLLHDCQ